MNINLSSIVKTFIPFFVIALVAYIIGSLLYFKLPKSNDLELKSKDDYRLEYKKYKIRSSMEEKVVKKAPVKKKPPKKKEYQLISNIILKAIYASPNNKGWIIISEKSSSATHILTIGDEFKKFKLKSVFKTYVIFTKNGKEYKLSMGDEKQKPKYTIKKEEVKVKKEEKKIPLEIEEKNGDFEIKRALVNDYIKNPMKIWKNIKIKERLVDGKIDGFRVMDLTNKSIFKKLGLRRGDIIKKVNNIVLGSYADAFKLYKKIDKIENLNFVIIRDGQEMEIDYEIR